MIILKSIFNATVLVLLLTSSSNDLSDSMVVPNFTCMIDGNKFDTTIAFAAIENTISDGVIQIIGQKNDDLVELVIDQSEAKNGATIKAEGGLYLNGKTYSVDDTAIITITKHTAIGIAGTFTMEAVDDYYNPTKTVKVTQGKFDVIFQ